MPGAWVFQASCTNADAFAALRRGCWAGTFLLREDVGMSTDAMIAAALSSLAGPGDAHADALRLAQPMRKVPQFEGQPLYVGKAERNLNGRDVGTHFAAGKTGSSTVRRSLAALLATKLALVAVPRNLAKPDGSANFALDAASEERLSSWMAERLSLATWVKSAEATLDEMETVIVRRLRPPLNLDKVGESRDELRQARKANGRHVESLDTTRRAIEIAFLSQVTARYRLNRYGDRHLNNALHIVVQSRIQYLQATRDYVARRTAEGKTSREIKRCLARYVARDFYRLLESGSATA
jgi:hypothetical protein